MTTSDANAPVAELSVTDITKIIAAAKTSANNPVSVAMGILAQLSDNAMVVGSTLREALSVSGILPAGSLAVLLNAIDSVAKTGDLITVANRQEVHIEFNGTPVRLKTEVRFTVTNDNGLPALNNIVGTSVHKLFWFDIQSIQLKEDQGKKVIRVVTSGGARDFGIG